MSEDGFSWDTHINELGFQHFPRKYVAFVRKFAPLFTADCAGKFRMYEMLAQQGISEADACRLSALTLDQVTEATVEFGLQLLLEGELVPETRDEDRKHLVKVYNTPNH